MAPNIETYAPFLAATLGEAPSEATEHLGGVPHNVADRTPGDGPGAEGAFLQLLDLLPGRLEAPRVLDLLSRDEVHRRFGLEPTDLALVQEWVREANERWGRDAAHRASPQLGAEL